MASFAKINKDVSFFFILLHIDISKVFNVSKPMDKQIKLFRLTELYVNILQKLSSIRTSIGFIWFLTKAKVLHRIVHRSSILVTNKTFSRLYAML